jgi:predicted hotdog family 3-hydroxylacyl-ACP dehydratase
MCLIDELVSWDEDSILCRTRTHFSEANPLRRDGRLASVHLIEYAGQAAALHGGLAAPSADAGEGPSVLAAVKDVELHVDVLDEQPIPLTIYACRLLQAGPHAIYRFRVDAGGRSLCSGQLAVMSIRGADR